MSTTPTQPDLCEAGGPSRQTAETPREPLDSSASEFGDQRHPLSELLSDYLDGELGPAQAQAVEAALVESAALRAELAQLKAMVAALSGLRDAKPPRDFVERVTKVAATGRRLQETLVESLASMPMQIIGLAVVLIIAAAYFFLHTALAPVGSMP